MIGQLVLARAVLKVSRIDLDAAARAHCARRGALRRLVQRCTSLWSRDGSPRIHTSSSAHGAVDLGLHSR